MPKKPKYGKIGAPHSTKRKRWLARIRPKWVSVFGSKKRRMTQYEEIRARGRFRPTYRAPAERHYT